MSDWQARDSALRAAVAATSKGEGAGVSSADSLTALLDRARREGPESLLAAVLLEAGSALSMPRPDKASWDTARREQEAVVAMRDGSHLRGRGALGRLTEAVLRTTAHDSTVRDAAKAESMALDALEARPSNPAAQWVLASCTAQLATEGRATASEGREAFDKAVHMFGGDATAPASLLLEAGTFLRVRCRELGAAERMLEAAVVACSGSGWRDWTPKGPPVDRDHPLAAILGEALAQLALVAHTGSSAGGAGAGGGGVQLADAERLYRLSLS